MLVKEGFWDNDKKGLYISFYCSKPKEIKDTLDILDGNEYELILKRSRHKRSLDANAYAWTLIDKIAEATRQPKTDVYRHFIKDVGGNSDTYCMLEKAVDRFCEVWQAQGLGWITETTESKLPNCKTVIAYFGSSSYDTSQMSRFIDLIIDEAKELNIETKTPQELELLIERWGEDEK